MAFAAFNQADINSNVVSTQYGPLPTVATNGNITVAPTLQISNTYAASLGGVKPNDGVNTAALMQTLVNSW
jgi:uncharacterized membrane protein YqiK